MEKSKYYTPLIEEFCEGFEYEIITGYPVTREGDKIKFHHDKYEYEKKIFELPDLNDLPKEGNKFCSWQSFAELTRVKYLDKADIEELGFTSGIGHISQADRELLFGDLVESYYLQKDHNTYFISYFKDKDRKILIYIYNNQTMEFGEFYRLFNGIIKNKTELKKLLKQLGI
jgi:hypothetical protein